ncbi:hypothetical protein V1512DRAFT_262315 [Lipomyces arxii]|uniref:uncharacterized protein n=1 Tax=Lipomyces arxii TaxID=56418 RepID=UPI0034CF81F8
MSPGQSSDDPWNDDWIPQVSSTKMQTPAGVLTLSSNDQVKKLFDPTKSEMTTSSPTPTYEVQSSVAGSQFRPQLRILKRTPDAKPAQAVTPTAEYDARPGETEAQRMERVRRDKEAKYKAARQSIFGSTDERTSSPGPRPGSRDSSQSSGASRRSTPEKQANGQGPGILRAPKGPDGTTGFRKGR